MTGGIIINYRPAFHWQSSFQTQTQSPLFGKHDSRKYSMEVKLINGLYKLFFFLIKSLKYYYSKWKLAVIVGYFFSLASEMLRAS